MVGGSGITPGLLQGAGGGGLRMLPFYCSPIPDSVNSLHLVRCLRPTELSEGPRGPVTNPPSNRAGTRKINLKHKWA